MRPNPNFYLLMLLKVLFRRSEQPIEKTSAFWKSSVSITDLVL